MDVDLESMRSRRTTTNKDARLINIQFFLTRLHDPAQSVKAIINAAWVGIFRCKAIVHCNHDSPGFCVAQNSTMEVPHMAGSLPRAIREQRGLSPPISPTTPPPRWTIALVSSHFCCAVLSSEFDRLTTRKIYQPRVELPSFTTDLSIYSDRVIAAWNVCYFNFDSVGSHPFVAGGSGSQSRMPFCRFNRWQVLNNPVKEIAKSPVKPGACPRVKRLIYMLFRRHLNAAHERSFVYNFLYLGL